MIPASPIKIFLTGVSGGLGKLLAEEFIKDNYLIIGSDIHPKGEIAEKLTDYYPFDLSKNEKIGMFIDQLFHDHPDIGVVINNAGILDFRFFEEYSDGEVMRFAAVNLVASQLIVKNCLPHFKKSGKGKFITVSSSSSFRGFETGCLYTPTKSGLNLFTESLRKELMIMKKKTGVDITINNVCPGRVATKEFLAENPKINPRTLLSHEIVYRKILQLINSDRNGEVIPIFPAKLKREILMKEVKRFLF